jgi:hypothetical protein
MVHTHCGPFAFKAEDSDARASVTACLFIKQVILAKAYRADMTNDHTFAGSKQRTGNRFEITHD